MLKFLSCMCGKNGKKVISAVLYLSTGQTSFKIGDSLALSKTAELLW
jgi:hypothetical protein